MSNFRVKNLDKGFPDDWIWRIDETSTPGDDIVAADPNDLGLAIQDTQKEITKIGSGKYSPGSLFDPSKGIMHRIKDLEGLFTTQSFSLQSAYDVGNTIFPTLNRPIIFGAAGDSVFSLDSDFNINLRPISFKIFNRQDNTKYLQIASDSIRSYGGDITFGVPNTHNTNLSGNEIYFQDARVTAPIPFSDISASTLPIGYNSILGALSGISTAIAAQYNLQSAYDISGNPQIEINSIKGALEIAADDSVTTPALILKITDGWVDTESLKVAGGICEIKSNGEIITSQSVTASILKSNIIQAPGTIVFKDVNVGYGAGIVFSGAGAGNNALPGGASTLLGSINTNYNNTVNLTGTVTKLGLSHDLSTGRHYPITVVRATNPNDPAITVTDTTLVPAYFTVTGSGAVIATAAVIGGQNVLTKFSTYDAHLADPDGMQHSNLYDHMNNVNNPHHSVGSINIVGFPGFINNVVLTPGTGIDITGNTGTNEIIVSAMINNLQSLYDASSTGDLILSPGKDFHFKNASAQTISSFLQGSVEFEKNINIGFGAGSLANAISAKNTLALSSRQTMIIQNTVAGNINISAFADLNLNAGGAVNIETIPFQPASNVFLPSYMPQTLMQNLVFAVDNSFFTTTNKLDTTLVKGTAVFPKPFSNFYYPSNSFMSTSSEDLGDIVGIVFSDAASNASLTVQTNGKIKANIGTMGVSGNFAAGETLYIGRKGFAEIGFTVAQTGTVVDGDTITIDAGGRNKIFTARTTPGTGLGEFGIPVAGTPEEFVDLILENLLEALNDILYQPLSFFYAYLLGESATADIKITGAVTAGETVTINGPASNVIFTAVDKGNKTNDYEFEISSLPEVTANNLAKAINKTISGVTPHEIRAQVLGALIALSYNVPAAATNNSTLATTSAGITVTTPFSGAAPKIVLYMAQKESGTTINTTSNSTFFAVSNFSSDEFITSQFISARWKNSIDRPRPKYLERDVKVGVIVSIDDLPNPGDGATIVFN